jgi:hypothetical protein
VQRFIPRNSPPRPQDLLDRQEAESIATSHLFERSSVDRELHAAAMLLRRGLGRVNVAEALDFARKDDRFMRPFPESRFLTTREAMQEETDMLKLVEAGRGKSRRSAKARAGSPPVALSTSFQSTWRRGKSNPVRKS